jgi:hypothetical protein
MDSHRGIASQHLSLRNASRITRLILPVALLATALLAATAAQASTLEIQISGLDLQYDGTNIFDASVHNTIGDGIPAESDPLTLLEFYVDGNLVGSQSTNVFADIYIADVLNIPDSGGFVNSSGNGDAFGIDLLTQNQTPGWGVALNIDTMQFVYTGSQISITLAGLASSLHAQDLPFGLAFDPSQQITIVLSSANLSNVTAAGGFLTGFNATGTGNIAGTLVPEPSSIALAGLGLAAIAAVYRRRRSR